MTKPSEEATLNRRQLLTGVGVAVLTMQCLPLTADTSGAADNLTIHFTPGLFSHVHDLLIPWALLKAPPAQGVELKTTEAMFHTHTVKLTQEQLRTVNGGGRVTGKASSHVYVIALAK
jgi:hypothetical protein